MTILGFLLVFLLCRSSPASSEGVRERSWVFAFYMSYDNGLSPCGERILAALKENASRELSDAVDAFTSWTSRRLIVAGQVRNRDRDPGAFLSIFLPNGAEQARRYSFLPIYLRTDLDEMLDLLAGR